jgi:murein DD-endopeptidase MepM/ murein hydrolase activator NlpD
MQLILVSSGRGRLGRLTLTSGRLWLCVFGLALSICGLVFYGGFRVASVLGVADPETRVAAWRAELDAQQTLLDSTQRTVQQHLDALALRLGQMNAHVVRLDALGARLTQMANLNDGEFDFSSPPSMGGPEEPALGTESPGIQGVVAAFDGLSAQLDDRRQQFSVLEDLLLDRKLKEEVHPEGRPVSAGYISSNFGNRTDPFTGRKAFHKGIDFAGRSGAEVIAVASGVVIWSGPRYGYGELVEVNHGNGYVTRYAHNAGNLVAVGDTVKRGQVIARLGGTGRATGPNLHFEVLRNGDAVNPLTYIR